MNFASKRCFLLNFDAKFKNKTVIGIAALSVKRVFLFTVFLLDPFSVCYQPNAIVVFSTTQI